MKLQRKNYLQCFVSCCCRAIFIAGDESTLNWLNYVSQQFAHFLCHLPVNGEWNKIMRTKSRVILLLEVAYFSCRTADGICIVHIYSELNHKESINTFFRCAFHFDVGFEGEMMHIPCIYAIYFESF